MRGDGICPRCKRRHNDSNYTCERHRLCSTCWHKFLEYCVEVRPGTSMFFSATNDSLYEGFMGFARWVQEVREADDNTK